MTYDQAEANKLRAAMYTLGLRYDRTHPVRGPVWVGGADREALDLDEFWPGGKLSKKGFISLYGTGELCVCEPPPCL